MQVSVCDLLKRISGGAVALALGAGVASAQTTVTLNQTTTVVSATLRGGSYASTNFSTTLETRKASDLSYQRHALLKFDTDSTIPAGVTVTSAVLTLQVLAASEDASRRIGVYQVTQSWDEDQTTWNVRRTGTSWATPGGDLGTRLAIQTVGGVGSRVSFDVTALVQQAVNGQLGSSRYSRVALVDLDEATSASFRAYVTQIDGDVAARPTLRVTYDGSGTSEPPIAPPPPPTSGTTLRVLEYNVHHGGWGTDGVYDPNRVVNWIVRMNPDIISLCEMEKGTGWVNGADGVALYKSLLESKTGRTWYALHIQDYGDWNSNGIRNAILSKYPFLATDRHEFSVGKDRTVGMVTISVNGRNVNFFSTHFDPDNSSYRNTQARELVAYLRGFSGNQLVLGDFNAQPTTTAITTITSTYYDAWAEAVKMNTDRSASDNPNGYTRNSRIDFVFWPRAANNLRLISAEVVDTRDSSGYMPSDHRPLVAVFKVQ